jgi:hypothetical protein
MFEVVQKCRVVVLYRYIDRTLCNIDRCYDETGPWTGSGLSLVARSLVKKTAPVPEGACKKSEAQNFSEPLIQQGFMPLQCPEG